MNKRTRENVTACHAVDLSYWSEHRAPNHLWAVDENQRPHVVRVDRKAGTVSHVCGIGAGVDNVVVFGKCPETLRQETYTIPATVADLPICETIQDEPTLAKARNRAEAVRDHVLVGHIGPAPEARMWGADRAAALINENPSKVSTLHVDYLIAALGATPHDDLIREEIARRKDAS